MVEAFVFVPVNGKKSGVSPSIMIISIRRRIVCHSQYLNMKLIKRLKTSAKVEPNNCCIPRTRPRMRRADLWVSFRVNGDIICSVIRCVKEIFHYLYNVCKLKQIINYFWVTANYESLGLLFGVLEKPNQTINRKRVPINTERIGKSSNSDRSKYNAWTTLVY